MARSIIIGIFLLIAAFQGLSTKSLIIKKPIADTIPDSTVVVGARQARNAMMSKDSLSLMIKERQGLLQLKSQYENLAVRDSVLIASLDKNISLADELIANLKQQRDDSKKIASNNDKIAVDLTATIKKKNKQILKIVGLSLTVVGVLVYLLVNK